MKGMDRIVKIIATLSMHVLFGSIVTYVYLSLVQLEMSFASRIDTATAMIIFLLLIMVVRGVSAAVLIPKQLTPGIGLMIFWIINGSLFVEYGVSLIMANMFFGPMVYIACHSLDVGVLMGMSGIERWWRHQMEAAT